MQEICTHYSPRYLTTAATDTFLVVRALGTKEQLGWKNVAMLLTKCAAVTVRTNGPLVEAGFGQLPLFYILRIFARTFLHQRRDSIAGIR
jgi:hypothetical protein